METHKFVSLLALAVLALLTFYSSPAEACMCEQRHPQTHYCSANYVAVVRVLRKSQRLVSNKIAYKLQVKKTYKMNEEAEKMFTHGRIVTPDSDSMCSVNLEIGKLYLIAGTAPQFNLCSYVKEYQKMSIMERRGFAGAYQKGCKCAIKPCYGNHCVGVHQSSSSCIWYPSGKCETDYSTCVPSRYRTSEGIITKCHWRKTPLYNSCLLNP